MIKQLSLFIIVFQLSFSFQLKADEGMWLPLLLKHLNESDMQQNGLKLSAEDIYSINKSSLKDGIVQFGGGCTAEVISNKGLILTNHHCGYGQIQVHSSIQNDYLTNGFWAMKQSDELTNPGLTVTFIVRMEDVTSKVLSGVTEPMTDIEREKKVNENSLLIIKEAIANSHYSAFVRPFFYGNEYYMFITETFKDVRLVGAPPSSIGKFGGDTDNWIWPRHTGDFSIFRIYANKSNEPADYSPDNVPYIPKYVIPITLKGVEQNDFTMVYGFPGRTSEYLSSYGVNLIMNESDPTKVKIREKKLSILEENMKTNDSIRIQYSAKYASIANYWKKWQGEMNGLKKFDALGKKMQSEKEFLAKLPDESKGLYSKLFSNLENSYKNFSIVNKQRDYYMEAILGIEAISYASSLNSIIDSLVAGKKSKDFQTQLDKLKNNTITFYKDFNINTDKELCSALLKMYSIDIDQSFQPEIFKEIAKKYKSDYKKYAEDIYSKSIFSSKKKIMDELNGIEKNYKKIQKDPIYKLMRSCYLKFTEQVRPQYNALDADITRLNRIYVKGLRELNSTKKFYPDANSTLRIAYGKVNGYYPRDGVFYNYYSTIEGIMEKENPLSDEFSVSPKLKELYNIKDYGQYADKNGELRVSFCANNHTTGGNSGSPVFNGEGQLIGTNFDRNWEGTMSDIMYDPNQVRNIVLDIRYTLFVVDKYAGAGYLLNEMTIVK